MASIELANLKAKLLYTSTSDFKQLISPEEAKLILTFLPEETRQSGTVDVRESLSGDPGDEQPA